MCGLYAEREGWDNYYGGYNVNSMTDKELANYIKEVLYSQYVNQNDIYYDDFSR